MPTTPPKLSRAARSRIKELETLAKWYQIPENPKTGKPTTGKDFLTYINEKVLDPVIESALLVRSLTKMISNDCKNWTPHADGKVHPQFHFSPPQGQVGSRGPNVQNCSKHTKVGQEFREIVSAPEGYVYVEVDWQRFHVHTMAWLAEDLDYLRFARLDSHSIFCSHFMGNNPIDMKWADSDIILAAKATKKEFPVERQKVAKPVVLANQLGQGARNLYRRNRKNIESEKRAKELQGILKGLFPKVKEEQDRIQERADRQEYLIDSWGRIDYFHDVFTWKWNKWRQQWIKNSGTDHEKVLAHAVQGTAFGVKYQKLDELEEIGANEEFNYCNDLHDALTFMPEVGKLDRCIETVYQIMTSPVERLRNKICPEGLWVGCDVSVGRNWKSWDKETNAEGMREIKI